MYDVSILVHPSFFEIRDHVISNVRLAFLPSSIVRAAPKSENVDLGVANLMIHNHMSHNQAKNGYLVFYIGQQSILKRPKKIFKRPLLTFLKTKKIVENIFLEFLLPY